MKLLMLIRALVLKLGFRPEYPSIFFSPSLSMTIGATQAMQMAAYDHKKVAFVDDRPGKHRSYGDDPTEVITLPKDLHTRQTLRLMKFCPLCGRELTSSISNDTKLCPRGHGLGEINENRNGLPAFVFELYGL